MGDSFFQGRGPEKKIRLRFVFCFLGGWKPLLIVVGATLSSVKRTGKESKGFVEPQL